MALRVDRLPDVNPAAETPPGWDELLDGSIWQLTPGQDFSGDAEQIISKAYTEAKRRNVKVSTGRRQGRVYLWKR